MTGGVTRRTLPHLSGVPHLHVNRPLNECQIYLGEREKVWEDALDPGARPLITYETTMAARSGKRSVLTIVRKIGDCKQVRSYCAHYPNNGW